ncbi:MAG: hypothetical protein Q7S57_04205 [bacterium]|nr:hypothetical protein [bacterium]
MKYVHKIIIVVIGIAIVAFLIGGVIYLYVKLNTVVPAGINVTTKVSSPALISYSNNELGISFDYPASWGQPIFKTNPETYSSIIFPSDPNLNFQVTLQKASSLDSTSGSGYYPSGIVEENILRKAYKNAASEEFYNALEMYSNLKSDQKEEKIDINGHEAIRVSYVFHSAIDPSATQYAKIFISASNNRVITLFYSYDLAGVTSKQSILDKVISSLKLDDSASRVGIVLPLSRGLVGEWQKETNGGALYQFFASGKFNYLQCSSKDLGYSGYWKVVGNNLQLTKVVKTTGELSCVQGNSIIGKIDTQKYVGNQVEELSVSSCDNSEGGSQCLQLGNTKVYRYNFDPTDESDELLRKEPVL